MINKIQLYILIWWWCECGIPYFYLFVQWTQCWMYCSVRRVHIQYIHIRIHTLTLHIHIQILTLTFMHMNLHTHTLYKPFILFWADVFMRYTFSSSCFFSTISSFHNFAIYVTIYFRLTHNNSKKSALLLSNKSYS